MPDWSKFTEFEGASGAPLQIDADPREFARVPARRILVDSNKIEDTRGVLLRGSS